MNETPITKSKSQKKRSAKYVFVFAASVVFFCRYQIDEEEAPVSDSPLPPLARPVPQVGGTPAQGGLPTLSPEMPRLLLS
jgi:hypothetical protein